MSAKPPVTAQDDSAFLEEYLNRRLSGRAEYANVACEVKGLGWSRDALRPGDGKSRKVLSVRMAPSTILVGPLKTGDGPCGTCLEMRWLGLHDDDECALVGRWVDSKPPRGPGLPQLSPFAMTLMWGLVEKLLTLDSVKPSGGAQGAQVFVLNLETHQIARHGLMPDSRCPVCSESAVVSTKPLASPLKSSERTDPEHCRLRKIDDIPLLESSFTNPLCGALGKFTNRDYRSSVTAPVGGEFWFSREAARYRLHWGGHANNYRDSVAIGLIEGMERRSGAAPRLGVEEVFDSYRNLKADALDPRECGVYEPGLFQEPDVYWVPFHDDLKVHWVWGYSLTERRPILVPEQLVYYCDHIQREPLFVHECSNGCATGSSLTEAALYGLIELIERDAFLISWFARLELPELDCEAVQSREFQFTHDRIRRAGYSLSLWDMRLDLPVPIVRAAVRKQGDGLGALLVAACGSFDPMSAITGAVSEVATYLGGFEWRIKEKQDQLRPMVTDFRKVRLLEDHPSLYGLPEMLPHAECLWSNPRKLTPAQAYADWESERPRTRDQLDDVMYCVDHLKARGLSQVILVDQTSREQEEAGLHTAAVVVPGLVPIDFGYDKRRYLSLQRTFSVPAACGFRDRVLTPADLNPAPHPFP